MQYCYVKNGVIERGPMSLPKNWEDTSNFNLLGSTDLLSRGWYPHRFVPANIPANSVITAPTFVVEGNEVVEYQNYRAKTQQEIDVDTERGWDAVRRKRNKLLQESDWTQGADSPLTQQKKTEWATYRQTLRQVPENFTNPNDVIWPTPPSN